MKRKDLGHIQCHWNSTGEGDQIEDDDDPERSGAVILATASALGGAIAGIFLSGQLSLGVGAILLIAFGITLGWKSRSLIF